MAAVDFKWYCLRAISGKELKVKEVLEAGKAAGDFKDGLDQVVVPTEQVAVKRGEKKVIKEKVLFSGYVFVRCRLTPDVQAELESTSNVVAFLRGRTTNKPEPLPDEQVAEMLGAADSKKDVFEDSEFNFLKGESVKVTDGPFKDFEGEITDINDEKQKLKVEVKIFGRKTQLELDYNQVTKQE